MIRHADGTTLYVSEEWNISRPSWEHDPSVRVYYLCTASGSVRIKLVYDGSRPFTYYVDVHDVYPHHWETHYVDTRTYIQAVYYAFVVLCTDPLV